LIETLREVEQIILRVRLDGYPIGADWMSGRGWRVAFDSVTTVLVLIMALLAVAGLYFLGLRAVLWIAKVTT
jgi:hypothetical protein